MTYGTLNVDSVVNSDGVTSGGLYGFKNRIINGAMVIDQRNAGASLAVTNGAWSVDRWQFEVSASSKLTAQQSSTAPAGFNNSLLVSCVSSYTVGATDSYLVRTHIEGYNFADLNWGGSDAQPVTLSFRVRSSITGTFGGALRNNENTRSYPFSYTINSADTWETKTVTIVGDTTGTWEKTNQRGVTVMFSFGTGSTNSAAAGAWASGNYQSATGASSLGTSGATFYLTGVQLEKGSTATSFDYRPYGTELALCQRYFFKWENTTGSAVYAIVLQAFSSSAAFGKLIDFPVSMRSSPTITTSGSFYPHNATGTSSIPFSSLASFNATPTSLGTGGWTGSAGLAAGNATGVGAANNSSLSMSAEL
jgi:hypothetical protein